MRNRHQNCIPAVTITTLTKSFVFILLTPGEVHSGHDNEATIKLLSYLDQDTERFGLTLQKVCIRHDDPYLSLYRDHGFDDHATHVYELERPQKMSSTIGSQRYSIRGLDESSAEGIRNLLTSNSAYFQEGTPRTIGRHIQRVTEEDGFVFGVFLEGSLVGTATLVVREAFGHRVAWIDDVMFSQDISQDAAVWFLQHIASRAHSKGASNLIALCSSTSRVLATTYTEAGFTHQQDIILHCRDLNSLK